MTRQQVIDLIAAHRHELQAQGVKSLALFGSVAREQAKEGSDVDVVVELNRPMGLFGLSELRATIARILGVQSVDLIVRDGIHPALKDVILEEAVYVI